MLRVALTGGIASGKSTVSDLFQKLGVPVIDTDRIARELVQPGQAALQQIIAHFGPSIVLADGTLDRAALRKRIFASAEERHALESILHPAIHAEVLQQLANLQAPYAIIVIPLLAETAIEWPQDRVLLVDAPEETQLQRLMRRDGASQPEAQNALHSQASRAQRQAVADDILCNDGSTSHLKAEVERLHGMYLALAGADLPGPPDA